MLMSRQEMRSVQAPSRVAVALPSFTIFTSIVELPLLYRNSGFSPTSTSIIIAKPLIVTASTTSEENSKGLKYLVKVSLAATVGLCKTTLFYLTSACTCSAIVRNLLDRGYTEYSSPERRAYGLQKINKMREARKARMWQ